jgi:ketosteroid isomerase-like protein
MTTPDSPTVDLDALMGLWTAPPADDAAALAAVRELYTDPVVINGAPMTAPDLLARIRATQRAYRELTHEIIERVDAPGRLVIAFRMGGVHVGPLASQLGTVAATGRPFQLRVIDVLTLTDGRISAVTMVADELGQLTALGAVALV